MSNSQKPPKLSRRGLSRLVQLLLVHRWSALGGMVGVVTADAVELSVPWITKLVVDRLEAKTIAPPELIRWGLFVLFLGWLSFFSKQLWRHLILGASKKVEANLRRQLLDKTLSLTAQGAKETETGKFMALASNDIPAIGQALCFGLISFFDSVFITLVAALLMFELSPALTGWALLPFPLLGLFMIVSMQLIYKRWDTVQETLEKLTEKTRESLSGMRTLRAYAQAPGDIASFEVKNRRYLHDMLHYVKIDATFSPIILLFAGSSSAVLLFFGGRLVVSGELSIGSLAAFIGYLGILTWPMIAAGWMLVLLQRGSASIDRLDAVLNSTSEGDTGPPVLERGTLEVRNLSFAYASGPPVLEDWSLTCAPGQVVGIVGPVGSGKSTLLRILLALEEIPMGSVYLGDEDLATFDKVEVRRLFSLVAQEPFLFSDSIASNLRLGNSRASDDDLASAVEVADLTADLALFPQGLDTELGERGISLSGGQKQRAALARAWLKPSPFLLLDDTLSAVDTLTERRILAHLREDHKGPRRGVIVVSHRLSAVRDADEIIVAGRDGRIADRGRHQDLAARPGLYRELLRLQHSEETELV